MIPLPNQLIPGGDLEFNPGLPTNYNGKHLVNAAQAYAKTNSASIATQLITAPLYSIRLTVAKFFQNIRAMVQTTNQGFYLRFQLKCSQRFIVNAKQRVHIREGQFLGIYMGEVDCLHRFQSHKEYHSLDLYYSPELLTEFRDAFPQLGKWIFETQTKRLPFVSFRMNQAISNTVYELLEIPVDHGAGSLYYDLKVRELLSLIFTEKFKIEADKIAPTPFEKYRVLQAAAILKRDLSKKSPGLRILARMVGMNECRLRECFKQEFKMSVADWVVEEKMQLAQKLLLTTNEPVKFVAQQVGYAHTSYFITAYNKRFLVTPASHRR